MNINDRLTKLKLNTTLAILNQVVTVIIGLILPRFFLRFFGSDVYGLVSSITQFLSLVNLCDMGMGAVISSALYKPLASKNRLSVSQIVAYSRHFYKIVGIILIIYIGILSVVYPFIVRSSFSPLYTIALLWSMSLSLIGEYLLGISNRLLLNADQRGYVELFISTIAIILNAIFSILIIMLGGSIQIVKLSTSFIFLIRPLFMDWYVKRHYRLDLSVKPNGKYVPQKKNGIIQHVAYMVYENTDVAVLTIFSTLANVSIYSVYGIVNNGLKNLINSITSGFQALFGNILADSDKETLINAYDYYDWIMHSICTFIYTLSGILIVPFVLTYTRGIHDANYNVPVFACIITLACACNVLRNAVYTIIKAAGHYRQTQIASIIEAIINLSVSIIFVFNYGLIGVAIGTLLASAFFLFYEMYYLSKHILMRPLSKFFKQIIIDTLIVFSVVFLTRHIKIYRYTYFDWFLCALKDAGVALVVFIGYEFVFYRQNIKSLLTNLRNKGKR